MTKKFQKYSSGFTLIELLVVIAIIGILASVILASLNIARAKGADAAIKSDLANMRAQADLYYDVGQTYVGVCDDPNMTQAQAAAEFTGGNIGGDCSDDPGPPTSWVAWAPLKTNTLRAWCVDNTGQSGEIDVPGGPITVCP